SIESNVDASVRAALGFAIIRTRGFKLVLPFPEQVTTQLVASRNIVEPVAQPGTDARLHRLGRRLRAPVTRDSILNRGAEIPRRQRLLLATTEAESRVHRHEPAGTQLDAGGQRGETADIGAAGRNSGADLEQVQAEPGFLHQGSLQFSREHRQSGLQRVLRSRLAGAVARQLEFRPPEHQVRQDLPFGQVPTWRRELNSRYLDGAGDPRHHRDLVTIVSANQVARLDVQLGVEVGGAEISDRSAVDGELPVDQAAQVERVLPARSVKRSGDVVCLAGLAHLYRALELDLGLGGAQPDV